MLAYQPRSSGVSRWRESTTRPVSLRMDLASQVFPLACAQPPTQRSSPDNEPYRPEAKLEPLLSTSVNLHHWVTPPPSPPAHVCLRRRVLAQSCQPGHRQPDNHKHDRPPRLLVRGPSTPRHPQSNYCPPSLGHCCPGRMGSRTLRHRRQQRPGRCSYKACCRRHPLGQLPMALLSPALTEL